MSETATANKPETLLRVDETLVYLSDSYGLKISKSAFLNGVRAGTLPQPIRLTPSRPVWKKSDIDALVNPL
jgi:predicted DNA-binding transcriptional regulator AlpA